jgi:hypothetical protein
MARHIFRYPIELGVWNEHPLSEDPLHVEGEGDSRASFWAHRDFDKEPTLRRFALVGTGTVVPDGWIYWGTTCRSPSGFIWHLYESPEAPEG